MSGRFGGRASNRAGSRDLAMDDVMMPPRMQIVWKVLEGAKDVGNEKVIAACRRIIEADRIGWKKHGNPEDLRLVMSFN